MIDVRSTLPKRLAGLVAISVSLFSAASTLAQDSGASSDFKISGFLNITGGKIFSGSLDANYAGPPTIDGNVCPCYTADWGNAGVYTKSFSFKPESRVGLQLNYKPSANLNLVGQVVSRGSDTTPNVQWAYGGYKLDSHWEIQLGRKRVPLYYYSDFQDIGLSYPWVSPPPELYGWEVTNYNGASLRYGNNFGTTNLTASMFTGSEKVKDSLYQKLYYPGKTEVSWKNIAGGDIEVNNGPLTARVVYMKADFSTQNLAEGLDDSAKLNAFGFALNLDFDEWFLLSELTQLKRDFTLSQYSVKAPALTIGAGMRFGAWTPFINYAKYTEKSSDFNLYAPQSYKRASLSLRYDIGASSTVKAQLDRNTDSTNNFGGNNTLLRVSYDRVF